MPRGGPRRRGGGGSVEDDSDEHRETDEGGRQPGADPGQDHDPEPDNGEDEEETDDSGDHTGGIRSPREWLTPGSDDEEEDAGEDETRDDTSREEADPADDDPGGETTETAEETTDDTEDGGSDPSLRERGRQFVGAGATLARRGWDYVPDDPERSIEVGPGRPTQPHHDAPTEEPDGISGLEADGDRLDDLAEQGWEVGEEETAVDEWVSQTEQELTDAGYDTDEFAVRFDEERGARVEIDEESVEYSAAEELREQGLEEDEFGVEYDPEEGLDVAIDDDAVARRRAAEQLNEELTGFEVEEEDIEFEQRTQATPRGQQEPVRPGEQTVDVATLTGDAELDFREGMIEDADAAIDAGEDSRMAEPDRTTRGDVAAMAAADDEMLDAQDFDIRVEDGEIIAEPEDGAVEDALAEEVADQRAGITADDVEVEERDGEFVAEPVAGAGTVVGATREWWRGEASGRDVLVAADDAWVDQIAAPGDQGVDEADRSPSREMTESGLRMVSPGGIGLFAYDTVDMGTDIAAVDVRSRQQALDDLVERDADEIIDPDSDVQRDLQAVRDPWGTPGTEAREFDREMTAAVSEGVGEARAAGGESVREDPIGAAASGTGALVGAGAGGIGITRLGRAGGRAGQREAANVRRLATEDRAQAQIPRGRQRRRETDTDASDSDLGPDLGPFDRTDRRLHDPRRRFDDPEDLATHTDPTDPSGVSQQDIGRGVSGRGDPQPAPGVDLPEGGFSARQWTTTTDAVEDTGRVFQAEAATSAGVAAAPLARLEEAEQTQIEADAEELPGAEATATGAMTADDVATATDAELASVEESDLVGELTDPGGALDDAVGMGTEEGVGVDTRGQQQTGLGTRTGVGERTRTGQTPRQQGQQRTGTTAETAVGRDATTRTATGDTIRRRGGSRFRPRPPRPDLELPESDPFEPTAGVETGVIDERRVRELDDPDFLGGGDDRRRRDEYDPFGADDAMDLDGLDDMGDLSDLGDADDLMGDFDDW